jgi:hypothetical protein
MHRKERSDHQMMSAQYSYAKSTQPKQSKYRLLCLNDLCGLPRVNNKNHVKQRNKCVLMYEL